MAVNPDDKSLALFCDFENIALGVRDAKYKKFNIQHVLERLLVKGSIVVKKAYCDWERYKEFKGPMHEASFELIEIPHVRMSGKNSADIRMVVDALDLCYTKSHVDTFVIISGDSDFSPLVSKLRENAKTVIGVGVKNSTSDLLINNCDEFIYYDDLVRELERKGDGSGRRGGRKRSGSRGGRGRRSDTGAQAPAASGEEADVEVPAAAADAPDQAPAARDVAPEPTTAAPAKPRRSAAKPAPSVDDTDDDEIGVVDFAPGDDDEGGEDDLHQEGIELVIETAAALSTERGGKDKLWGSMIKQALKRRRPGFNESYYGFESFSKMLEEAEEQGLLKLEPDDRSGGYVILDITA